jgi:hypothetical protein
VFPNSPFTLCQKFQGSANAAEASDSDSDIEDAFFAKDDLDFDSDGDEIPNLIEVPDSESEFYSNDDMPPLVEVSDSESNIPLDDGMYRIEGENDVFSEINNDDWSDLGSSYGSEELSEADGSECSSFVSVDLDSDDAVEDVVALVSTGNKTVNSP